MILFCSHYHCEDQRLIFPILELQSKWAALVISGKILLPSEDDMLAEVHEHYRELDKNGFPKSLTHSLWHKVIIDSYWSLLCPLHFFSNIDISQRTFFLLQIWWFWLQFDYIDWLSDQVGLRIDDRVREIGTSLFEKWTSRANGLRDATVHDFLKAVSWHGYC